MANSVQFDLGDKHYEYSAPTALQLGTFCVIIEAYYQRKKMSRVGELRHIVDVGACIGKMALVYNVIWPDAKVLAIEPHPASFEYLKENCAPIPNIECLQIAASDREETFRLALPSPSQRVDTARANMNPGMASRYGDTDIYSADVSAKRLDDIVDFKVDLLKIDVEGMELSVLRGAERILSEDRPDIEIELRTANQEMAGLTIDDVVRYLAGFGYFPIGILFSDVWFTYHGIKPCSS